MVEVKYRLKEALDLREMRPADLCRKTGIPKNTLSNYMKGNTKPKADRVYQIAAALDVSEAWLLGYDVPMNRSAEQKKNDDLVQVIAQLRKDPEFFEVVNMLASLPASDYASIKQLISALASK
ncbi:MAG: helix-turn-helix transcriptional regulator [Alistipes sp.]|nr:helix-turn-helix transcriptional regulator [Alistipes sp.]